MLRTFRVGGGPLSLSRLPFLPFRNGTEATRNSRQIQRVRFSRPPFRPRAVLTGTATIMICYSVFSSVVLSPLADLAEELEKELDAEEQAELEKQGDSIFIPFPGTTKMVQPPPYGYKDPEWSEFVKISKNRDLQKDLKVQLIRIVKEMCEGHPLFVRQYGKSMDARRYWLDLDFPASPPPEFERSGIEIADDYVAWTTMPVDSHTVFRIRQALWPSAVTRSLWSFHKALLLNELRKVAGMLGIPTKPDIPVNTLIARVNQDGAGLANRKSLSKDDVSHPQPANMRETEEAGTNDVAPGTSSSAPGDKAQHVDDNPGLAQRDSTFVRAWLAFRTKFAQTWRPAESYPPRGSIYLFGLIEIETPTVLALLEVNQAAWDPQTRTWDRRSIRPVLKKITQKVQRPLGSS